jgi:hypothetical protein
VIAFLFLLMAVQSSAGVADPNVAVCDVLYAQGEDSEAPLYIQFDCPDDVEAAGELQTLANALSGRLDLSLVREGLFYDIDDTVDFRRADGEWAPVPGPPFIRGKSFFPTRLAEYGKLFYCAYAATPRTDGRGGDLRMSCLVGGRQVRRHVELAEEATRLSIENSRWMPTDRPYCYQDDFTIEIELIIRGGPGIEGQPLPDLNQLPMLCEQE